MTTKKIGAEKVYNVLLAAEINGKNAPDMRRVLTDERVRLQAAMQGRDTAHIQAVADEAAATARLWGVEI